MSGEGVTWYVQSRGRLPSQDYITWERVSGPAREAERSTALRLGRDWRTDSTLSVFCASDPVGTLLLVLDGIHSNTWPNDHSGRRIRARIIGIGTAEQQSDQREILTVASMICTGADMTQLLTFKQQSPGYSVHGDCLLALAEESPPVKELPPGEVAWGVSHSDFSKFVAGLSHEGSLELDRVQALMSDLLMSDEQRKEVLPRVSADQVGVPFLGEPPKKRRAPRGAGPLNGRWVVLAVALILILGSTWAVVSAR